MSKYTPGPLVAKKYGKVDMIITPKEGSGYEGCARIATVHATNGEEGKANAVLFAAAPALIAILIDLYRANQGLYPSSAKAGLWKRAADEITKAGGKR